MRTIFFLVLGYGDSIILTERNKRHLGYGNDYGRNQCVIISIAAAVEWLSQGRPRRCADDMRVGALAQDIREAEMMNANEAGRILQKPSTQMGVAIRSISHGAVYPIHHRDLRTLHLFIL